MNEKKIKDYLSLPITKLQFASASDWEHCIVIEKNSDKNLFDVWEQSISPDFIGVEAFFDVQGKEIKDAFIGFRINATAENISRCRSYVASFVDSASVVLLADFVSGDESVLSDNDFLNGEPDFMELGVVNHWNSFGPIRFWNKNDGSAYDGFLCELQTASRFLEILPAPAAIEFAFSNPIPHWIGLTVSIKDRNSFYVLSLEKVKTVLSNS